MSRHNRNGHHPCPEPVESYPVAPDFFNTPDSYDESAEYLAQKWSEWKDAHPYKVGMVVWIEFTDFVDGIWTKTARKAFISDIFPERDNDGWRRAKYRVHMANKTGNRFAKNWFYTWPGYIERGYRLMKRRRRRKRQHEN